MHICVGKLSIIGSDNGLLPGRRQAIIRTSVGILLTGPLGTNFSEILIEIHKFSFKKIHFKMADILSRPQCVKRQTISIPGTDSQLVVPSRITIRATSNGNTSSNSF